jgi:hypothetical protein
MPHICGKEKRNADGFHRRFLLLGLHFLTEGVDISFEQMGGGASRFFHLLLEGGGEGLVPKIHPFRVELPAKTGFDGEVGIELFGKTFDEIAGHIFWQGAAEIEMDGFLQQGLLVLFAKAAHLFGYFPHVNIAAQNNGVIFGEIDGGVHRGQMEICGEIALQQIGAVFGGTIFTVIYNDAFHGDHSFQTVMIIPAKPNKKMEKM